MGNTVSTRVRIKEEYFNFVANAGHGNFSWGLSNLVAQLIEAKADGTKCVDSKTVSAPITRLKKPIIIDDASLLVLGFLNKTCGSSFRPSTANIQLIQQILKDNHTPEDIMQVITVKHKEWAKDDVMAKYLRPITLFNKSKFSSYLGQVDILTLDQKLNSLWDF